MSKHPCFCADKYAGLGHHTMWQWGQSSGQDDMVRPSPPAVVEDMVRIASTYLVEEVLKLKPREVQE